MLLLRIILALAGCIQLVTAAPSIVAKFQGGSLDPAPVEPAADPLAALSPEELAHLKRYFTIVFIHAIFGALTWLLFAPLAVTVATVGRSWGPIWLKLHANVTSFGVFPLTIIGVILAVVATNMSGSSSTGSHSVLGFFIVALLFVQIGISPSTSVKGIESTRQIALEMQERGPRRWAHMILGTALLIMGNVNTELGFKSFEGHGGTVAPWVRTASKVVAVLPAFVVIPYLIVTGLRRLRAGETIFDAFFTRPIEVKPVYAPPQRQWNGTSTYIDEFEADGASIRSYGYDGESTTLHKSSTIGSISSTTTWQGHWDRDEYEADVRKSMRRPPNATAHYDYAPYGEEHLRPSVEIPTARIVPVYPPSRPNSAFKLDSDTESIPSPLTLPRSPTPPLPPPPPPPSHRIKVPDFLRPISTISSISRVLSLSLPSSNLSDDIDSTLTLQRSASAPSRPQSSFSNFSTETYENASISHQLAPAYAEPAPTTTTREAKDIPLPASPQAEHWNANAEAASTVVGEALSPTRTMRSMVGSVFSGRRERAAEEEGGKAEEGVVVFDLKEEVEKEKELEEVEVEKEKETKMEEKGVEPVIESSDVEAKEVEETQKEPDESVDNGKMENKVLEEAVEEPKVEKVAEGTEESEKVAVVEPESEQKPSSAVAEEKLKTDRVDEKEKKDVSDK